MFFYYQYDIIITMKLYYSYKVDGVEVGMVGTQNNNSQSL